MLSKHDLEWMSDTVARTITPWDGYMTLKRPLPEDQQPNYNKMMREYTGEIMYELIEDIPTESLDMTNINHESTDVGIGGDKINGDAVYCIPKKYTNKRGDMVEVKPEPFDIVLLSEYQDNIYRISDMRNRIGEIILILRKISGGTEVGNQYG